MSTLTKKLLVKPSSVWLIYNPPPFYLDKFLPLPEQVQIITDKVKACNGIQLFAENNQKLKEAVSDVEHVLTPDTIFWITYPKKGSTIQTDLGMMSSWDVLFGLGLRPVASVAIDDTWTALRFKPLNSVKESGQSNSSINQSAVLSAYIDTQNKKITLPPEVYEQLAKHPAALHFFEGLSYSHKKEYIVWILTAKQEKTRTARLEKMLEMLSIGKKNPTAK